MTDTAATYEIDQQWNIIRASQEFCREFRCTELGLLGRDVRDLMREDWRQDFRCYVARALVGVGDYDVTLPMIAPCGDEGWFKHSLEPLIEDGVLLGYRATITPHLPRAAAPAKRWWDWRSVAAQPLFDFGGQPLTRSN